MEKNLNTIQKITKILRILSKIAYIFCLIGTGACVVALVVTLVTKDAIIQNLQNMPIEGLSEMHLTIKQVYAAVIIGIIGCLSGAVLSRMSVKMYDCELEAGQPFDLEFADRMKKVGIWTIVMPLVVSFINSAIWAFGSAGENATQFEIKAEVSLTAGLTYLIVSLLIRYGTKKMQTLSQGDAIDEELSK